MDGDENKTNTYFDSNASFESQTATKLSRIGGVGFVSKSSTI